MRSFDVGRVGLWVLRVVWGLLPVVAGLTLDATLDGLERPLVVEVPAWVLWFGGLVATLVPSPIGLTALRLASPALVAWPVVLGVVDGFSGRLGIAAAYGVLVSVVVFSAQVGDQLINGSAYGSERRMALRPPAFALLGPVPGAWLVLFAATTALWWAAVDGRWLVAGVLAVVVAGVGWVVWRVVHQLARRWLVFVPAGFVIHDHVLAVDSILLRRSVVESLGPATVEDVARGVDLSGGARGLALSVALDEAVPFARRIDGDVVTEEAERLVFTPSLPGAVLREARIRAIRIGSATG